MSEINELINEILLFRNERNWKQFHNPKDLAISLNLEAAELLENFQWKSNEEATLENYENIKDELADVLIYSLILADTLELNVKEVIYNKLEQNKVKYPVEKAYGKKTKYTDL